MLITKGDLLTNTVRKLTVFVVMNFLLRDQVNKEDVKSVGKYMGD